MADEIQQAILEAELLQSFDVFEKRYKESLTLKLSIKAVQSKLIAKLGVNEFAVLMTIASFIDREGEAFPSQRKIAELTGLSLPTVNRTVNNLLKAEFNGQPLLSREFMLSSSKKKFSVYTLHPTVFTDEASPECVPTCETTNESEEVQAEPSDSLALDTVATHEAEIAPQSVPVALEDKLVEELPKASEIEEKAPIVDELKPQTKPRTSRDFLFYFKELYETTYQIPYVLNYGRDGAAFKNKLMPSYSEEELLALLEYIVKEYPTKWANDRYPYPNVSMIASWIATTASQEMKKEAKKDEAFQEVQALTASYIEEDYQDFDLI